MEISRGYGGSVSILVLAVLLVLSSCGYYGTGSRTAGDVKRIAVPYFQNETAEPDIEIEVTQQIIDGIVNDNTLKVVSEEEADAILEGSIIEYSNVPFTFNEAPAASGGEVQADQYRVLIGLRISLLNTGDNAYIWENKRINAHGDYYLEDTGEQTYEKALEEVYRDIVESILGATVEEW
ncbi:MAG: LptE family protein [bacterium]|nr:MAG: LptE family protein [bacterium]